MSRLIENPNGTIETYIAGARHELQRALFDRQFIPEPIQLKLRKLLQDGVRLYSQDEFENIHNNPLLVQSPNDEQRLKRLSNVGGVYIPEYVYGEAQIALNRDFLDKHKGNNYPFWALAEELAHASYVFKGFYPLSTITDGSLDIGPCSTKRQFLEAMKKEAANIGISSPLTEASVFLAPDGFKTNYFLGNPSKSDKPQKLPDIKLQIIMEEARAHVLKTLYTVKVIGARILPNGSLDEQLHQGVGELNSGKYGDIEDRIAGLSFLSVIAEPYEMMLERLVVSDISQFVLFLNKPENRKIAPEWARLLSFFSKALF